MIASSRRWILKGLAVFSLWPLAVRSDEPQRYICTYNECDPYIYDPVLGDPDNVAGDRPIPPGTAFADLPQGWLCPICGSPISYFEKTEERPA